MFAFEDDYTFGVLLSATHHEWARAQSSTLEDRFRYTPTTAFETFAFPDPSSTIRVAVAETGRAVTTRRREICADRGIGLTELYNEVDDGAYSDLAQLHSELDRAVRDAYGWPATVEDSRDANRRLLELNRAIAAGEVEYAPFSP